MIMMSAEDYAELSARAHQLDDDQVTYLLGYLFGTVEPEIMRQAIEAAGRFDSARR